MHGLFQKFSMLGLEYICTLSSGILLKKLVCVPFLLALIAVYYNWITVIQFVYVTAGFTIWFHRYDVVCFYLKKPGFSFQFLIM
jgi:hypothetical protein